ncbi:MAG TPA: heme exporter protein CcmB [Candidatus Binatia bacterium]|nr:heme exporter protein CcmB [Candidatus Binatia bacterium]
MRGAGAILLKDLRIEWRTRESLASVFVLGVLLLVVFTVAHDPEPEAAPALAPAVLWVAFVFTGLLGVQRGFLLERENDCMSGLLSAPVDPAAIYAGKLLANVVLLGVTQAVVVPLVGLFLHVDLWGVLPGLIAVLSLGNVGFASLATLFAAVATRTRAREVMLPLLLLPLLVPLLIGAVTATRAVLGGGLGAARDGIAVLIAFDVVFVVAGWLLFAYVVRD